MPQAVGALVVALLLNADGFAQNWRAQNWPSPRIERLDGYLTLVRGHEPGAADSAVYSLSRWPDAAIRALWLDLQTLISFARCGDCRPPVVKGTDGRIQAIRYDRGEIVSLRKLAERIRERREVNELLKRAAILHADVVMLAHPQGEPRIEAPRPPVRNSAGAQLPPTPQRVIVKSNDGRQESLSNDPIHWDIAYVLLDLVGAEDAPTPAPEADPTVRQWYRATTAYLLASANYDPLHFSRGLKLFPGEPDLHFLKGCLHEAMADSRVQNVLKNLSVPAGVELGVRPEHEELSLAEKSFRRVLELDPSRDEARIHLGRVLGRQGRHEPAATELRKVAEQPDPRLRYLTALFLGQEEEAIGRRDDARAAYLRAADTFPLAQSPQLALSHLAREAGERETALAAVKRVLDLPPAEVDRQDPYWYYHLHGGRFVDDWLAELYAPFRHKVTQ